MEQQIDENEELNHGQLEDPEQSEQAPPEAETEQPEAESEALENENPEESETEQPEAESEALENENPEETENENPEETENENPEESEPEQPEESEAEQPEAESEALENENPEETENENPEESEAKKPEKQKKTKEKVSVTHRVLTVIGIVMCVILIPLLISNVVLIIQSYTNRDKVPSLFSISPMIVLTDSMEPNINGGDLIFIKKIAPEDVELEDIIAFFDPTSKNNSVVTHRVKEINLDEDGNISFRTMGDANGGAMDSAAVPADKLVGRYSFRLRGMGSVAMFMQTTTGFILCVIIPLFLLIGYDVIRRRIYDKKKQADTEALLAEVQALKAEKQAAQTALAEAADENATSESEEQENAEAADENATSESEEQENAEAADENATSESEEQESAEAADENATAESEEQENAEAADENTTSESEEQENDE